MNKTMVGVSALAVLAATSLAQAAPDWSKVPGRDIVLIYPGNSSLEWVMKGTEHSGARAIKGGETCAGCHDKEAVEIGRKIVAGEKPSLQAGALKGVPGGIPVKVKAIHDGTNLYVRVEWKDVKSPGGDKGDKANPIKVAMMIGDDEVDYVKEGGCWATCHHDLRTMPDVDKNAPNHPQAKALDIRKNGPTKYLKESRTTLSIKDHPWGGWDKLKPDAEIDKEFKEGEFLDIVQYRSGAAPRDGHVLEARRMQEAPGVAEGKQDGDTWAVTFTRKLAGGGAGDHRIAAGKTYSVGFAIHNDHANERHHHVSFGYALALDNAKADINAVKQ